jgi:hypothetical protein
MTAITHYALLVINQGMPLIHRDSTWRAMLDAYQTTLAPFFIHNRPRGKKFTHQAHKGSRNPEVDFRTQWAFKTLNPHLFDLFSQNFDSGEVTYAKSLLVSKPGCWHF